MSSAVLIALTTQVVPPSMALVMSRVSFDAPPMAQDAEPAPSISQVMPPSPAPSSLNDSTRVLLKTRAVSSRAGSIVMLSSARAMSIVRSAKVLS